MTFITIILFVLFPPEMAKVQDSLDLNLLLETRWILKTEHSSGNYEILDELDFIKQNSPIFETLPMYLKYGGLTFEKGNVLKVHQWNKCGTGNPPDYHNAKWEIETSAINNILTISETTFWNGKYKIVYITKETMRLKRVKSD